MSKPWLLVTPASRGIGLQLAKLMLKKTNLPVIATARSHLDDVKREILQDTGADSERLEVLRLDVTDEKTISDTASYCKNRFSDGYLRLAFCLPGVLYPEKSPAQIDAEHALTTFRINSLGPLLLSKHFSAFLPRKSNKLGSYSGLPASAVLALMSARVGSITDNSLGGWYSYRASKAAVNQVAKSVDIHLKQRCGDNALCLSLHPGTVKTGLSKEFWGSTPSEKLFSPEFAASKLLEVVNGVGLEGRGRCWDWDGKIIPP